MIALAAAVFIASLLGSVHCAGMCGAFLAFAVNPSSLGSRRTSTSATQSVSLPVLSCRERCRNTAPLHAAYNLGRLLTYSTLGAIAGAVGAALDLSGSMVGLQRTAAILAGAMMVSIGLVAVLRASGIRIRKLPVPRLMQRLAMRGHRSAGTLPPFTRALATGLLTTLLPCGWLYAFVITAAGTGHPLYGAAMMVAFWLGTLPMMIGLGIGLQALTGRLRRHLPLATSILIVLVGLWTIASRWNIVGIAPAVDPHSNAISRVRHLNADQTCPLCK